MFSSCNYCITKVRKKKEWKTIENRKTKQIQKPQKNFLNAGNRTRVSGVKILNPSRLDYIEILVADQLYSFLYNTPFRFSIKKNKKWQLLIYKG